MVVTDRLLHSRRARAVAREFVNKFLSGKCCRDCKTTNRHVLEFDHVKWGKRYAIATMVSKGYSIKAIEEEIKKCHIRCANCHRLVTRRRRLRAMRLERALTP